MTIEEEKRYLSNLFNEIKYKEGRFDLGLGNGSYIFGMITPDNSTENTLTRRIQYNSIYNTITDLDFKIKLSFREAIEYAYSEAVNGLNYNIIWGSNSKEELLAYYFIENATFRTSTLWDMLAQIYRLHYNVDVKAYEVNYNRFFNPENPNCESFKEKAKEIYSYLHEENDTNVDGMWKGNHSYINEYRNKMTHRNSPNLGSMCDLDYARKNKVIHKSHPTTILKRVIEDYNVVSKYLLEIINIAEDKSNDEYKKLKNI